LIGYASLKYCFMNFTLVGIKFINTLFLVGKIGNRNRDRDFVCPK